MAYFLLYRHAHLILDDLTQHPHARDPEYRLAWVEARNAVRRSLAKLEVLRPRINKRYERSEERRRALATRASVPTGARSPGDALADGMRRISLDAHGSRNASPARLDAEEHRDLAVELANRKLRIRAERIEPPPVQQEGTRQDMSARMVEARRRMDLSSSGNGVAFAARPPSTTTYEYPHVPERSTSSTNTYPSVSTLPRAAYQGPRLPPSLPPKEPRTDAPYASQPPPLPSKTALPSSPPQTPSTPAPQFATTSHLENNTPLRTLFLPSPLRHRFLSLASPQTAQNLETCGILAGTLLQNALFITHLIIPEQTSTPDTCEMTNEASLHTYCDTHDLMVLGWIHTHPSQTCFLSSRDLHTHVWFQMQLPESVAIVCAPSKEPSWGVFRLTDPPGVGVVRACEKPGIFHPHEEGRLFTDALGRPGHVVEYEELRFEVVDLRPMGKGRV